MVSEGLMAPWLPTSGSLNWAAHNGSHNLWYGPCGPSGDPRHGPWPFRKPRKDHCLTLLGPFYRKDIQKIFPNWLINTLELLLLILLFD